MLYVPARKAILVLLLTAAAALAAGIWYDFADDRSDMWEHAAATTGGNPDRGEILFTSYGCGGCHALKYVPKATGSVGPPLDGVAVRAIIGGKLDNTPANLQRWIRDPQSVTPGTAMPRLGVTPRDARDITAFLYTRAE